MRRRLQLANCHHSRLLEALLRQCRRSSHLQPHRCWGQMLLTQLHLGLLDQQPRFEPSRRARHLRAGLRPRPGSLPRRSPPLARSPTTAGPAAGERRESATARERRPGRTWRTRCGRRPFNWHAAALMLMLSCIPGAADCSTPCSITWRMLRPRPAHHAMRHPKGAHDPAQLHLRPARHATQRRSNLRYGLVSRRRYLRYARGALRSGLVALTRYQEGAVESSLCVQAR